MPVEETYYPSGAVHARRTTENGQPANGWSVEEFHVNGQPARIECWSHGLLIEVKMWNDEATLVTHQIYNHRLKQLVNRPDVKPYARPNVVVGFGHMGFYFRHLPAIAAYIGAEYDEDALDAAYHRWMHRAAPEREPDEEWEPETQAWLLKGSRMRFGLWFEEGEMLYQWQLWAPDEERYWEARAFMEALPR
ncbi:MAG: hypothetical protein EOO08_04780 [Chitinophagaceae bacterium]|nr:MAG: hypothetical protein EOO08_04780 [Chitinophagaceae bacterium]